MDGNDCRNSVEGKRRLINAREHRDETGSQTGLTKNEHERDHTHKGR